jgi:D-tyrosyl-tRNA(Tyr) deacylase
MRILVQRVTYGSVVVDEEKVGEIGAGLVLLVGATHSDGEAEATKLANKVINLRIFEDEAGKFNKSLLDVAGEILVISQFTLYADARKGRRPSFIEAARPEQAEPLLDFFVTHLRSLGVKKVDTGRFGATMQVTIHNQGPVTIWLDSAVL